MVRCPRCGNENPDSHRYCGMCGASLLQGPGAAMATGQFAPEKTQSGAPATSAAAGTPASAAAPSVAASAPPAAVVAPRAPVAPAPRSTPRPADPVKEETAAISGPSFLGLNQPGPISSRRGRLSIDPDAHSGSRNLDYLLEDDEPRGGGWKIALMFIALVLAVGFGYLRWKNHGFPWLNAIKSPAAQTTAPDTNATAPGATSPNAAAGSSSPAAAPSSPANSNAPAAPGSAPTAQPTSGAPANSSTGTGSAPSATPAGSPPPIAPVASPNATQASGPDSNANAPANTAPAPNSQNPTSATPPGAPPSSAGSGPPAASGASDNTAGPASAAAASETAQPDEASKPPAAIKRAPAVDTVAQAQQYLYGKGVPQDCDRGMRLLKPAANGGNGKAMIEMGALYSAGLCTPRDLPTAYRWFAMALRKDPGNQAVATDLQKLWGEMTQPERQLAIRLSQ